jgi:hypothetical protein
MTSQQKSQRFAIFLVLLMLASTTHADETRYEIGLRANVLLGDGVPANDILGLGVIGRYRLKDGWFIGAGLDLYDYDFERPWRIVGLEQDPNVSTINAQADNTVLSGMFGRLYNETDHGFDWFWTLGIGFASPYNFSESWFVSFAARVEHHFMDVLITDRVTGNTAKVDSQSPLGAYPSLNYKF